MTRHPPNFATVITGLQLSPFQFVTKRSQRSIEHIAVPTLSYEASKSIVESMLPNISYIASNDRAAAIRYIAIASGGHARSLELILKAIEISTAAGSLVHSITNPKRKFNQVRQAFNVSDILLRASDAIPGGKLLSNRKEIMVAVLQVSLDVAVLETDIVISTAIAEGRLFASIGSATERVSISVSPLTLRRSILVNGLDLNVDLTTLLEKVGFFRF